MTRLTSYWVLLLLSVSLVLTFIPNFEVVEAEPYSIVVPDDYSSIQEAIDNAVDGDTIFVKSGNYVEILVIRKPISLIGASRNNTIIDGNNTAVRHVIEVAADDVQITGFTIRKSGGVKYYEKAGVFLNHSSNVNITDNIITENFGSGVHLVGSSHNLISGNYIADNQFAAVAMTYSSHNNTIQENTLVDNFDGIFVDVSDHQTIRDNVVESCNDGIDIGDSSGNTISGNIIRNSYNFGLAISRSPHNTIHRNLLTNNSKGIWLTHSPNNKIFQNNLTHNQHGLDLSSSSHNLIYANIIAHNEIGVVLTSINPVNNTLWHNDFLNDTEHAFDDAYQSDISWDNGIEGNYWDNYNGTDHNGDGIGDTSYVIDENNKDNYPLMEPIIIPEYPSCMILMVLALVTAVTVIYRRKISHLKRGEKP
ncbi:MAG: right-handed parallel beta-helix repeat-containing protein [Thermoproteota archaeon]